jgi:hypothetical protein
MGLTGKPQFPPDGYDSCRSHPACMRTAPLLDSTGVTMNGVRFGESPLCAVTYDMRKLGPSLLEEAAFELNAFARQRKLDQISSSDIRVRNCKQRLKNLQRWRI